MIGSHGNGRRTAMEGVFIMMGKCGGDQIFGFDMEELIRLPSPHRIHLLRVGWRNLLSSCAVVSVFCSGRK
jgi:hypothetical protein